MSAMNLATSIQHKRRDMTNYEYLPSASLVIWYLVFKTFVFEGQRWTRDVRNGRRGQSAIAVALPTLTTFLGTTLQFSAVFAILWFDGWRPAVGLLILGIVVGLAYGVISGILLGDRWAIQFLATLLAWPAGAYLIILVYHELS
jgi:hypothetical protein